MDNGHSSHPAPPTQPAPPARNLLARLALGFSIFAFLVPLGIAAIVLGHVAESRMESRAGAVNDKNVARAALWIAYLQLAMVGVIAVIGWGLFHGIADGFQRDAMVQRVFRSSDQFRTLDPDSAREAEQAAGALVYELVAIEDQSRRKQGSYICQVNELLWTGLLDSTDAEKRALATRAGESPYLFEIKDCNPGTEEPSRARYVLVAVPRRPRMPEDSAVFCTDQDGVVLSVRGGTSVDCLKNGQPVR